MALKLARLAVPLAMQFALVASLFLGSLGALVYNVFTVRTTPELERATSERLHQAASGMTRAAEAIDRRGVRRGDAKSWESASVDLGKISDRVLNEFAGIEGGFYLNGKYDRFSGYAYPTAQPRRHHGPGKSEPPPLEEPYIRIQARKALTLPAGQESITVHDVGPSRVMILTRPLGERRPAVAAIWLMYRLVDPRLLDRQVRRYQASTGIALCGLLLALLLMGRLGLNLKRQAVEQTRLRDALRRSERLAALGTLLAGVAHEIRNPLAAIRSTVQLWQRLPDRSRTPESLDAVIRSVDRLNHTVSQLLHFSRADGTIREQVDLHALLRETLELFAAQAGAQHVELDASLSGECRIYGSADALRQVFVNLTTNALQAMPRGGRLRVTTRWNDSGDTAVIEFVDSGEGIAAEVAPHLFEPFFTTRPEGTGLGLALCREIVAQHDGTIECVGPTDVGSRFQIHLPAGEKAP
jgi:two-component system, NtrC family, sensor histidine kinase HydH